MRIEDDNLSGAAVLTARALLLIGRLADSDYASRDEFLSSLKKECFNLSQSQKSMISLQNELSHVVRAAERGETLEEVRTLVKQAVSERLQFLKEAESSIVDYGTSLITEGMTVLTHSRSSTVEKILIKAYEMAPFHIIVTESRPNCEGRLLAEALSSQEIPVTFVVDAAATLFSPNLVLVGADSVTPLYIINKIGTRFLALSFPTYVACSTNKFTAEEIIIEEKNPEEVLKKEDKYKNVFVKNYYFDKTPLEYIRGFITEYGILTPEKVKSLLEI